MCLENTWSDIWNSATSRHRRSRNSPLHACSTVVSKETLLGVKISFWLAACTWHVPFQSVSSNQCAATGPVRLSRRGFPHSPPPALSQHPGSQSRAAACGRDRLGRSSCLRGRTFRAMRICTGVRLGGRASTRTSFVRKPAAHDGLASSRTLAWGKNDSRNG